MFLFLHLKAFPLLKADSVFLFLSKPVMMMYRKLFSWPAASAPSAASGYICVTGTIDFAHYDFIIES